MCAADLLASFRKDMLISVEFVRLNKSDDATNSYFLFCIYIQQLHLPHCFLVLIFMQGLSGQKWWRTGCLVEKAADPWSSLWTFVSMNGPEGCAYSLCTCSSPNKSCLWTVSQISLFKDDSVDCCEESSSCPVERPTVELLHVVTAEEFDVVLVKPFGGLLVSEQ